MPKLQVRTEETRMVAFRCPVSILDRIMEEARAAERNMSTEMVYRLRKSFDGDKRKKVPA